MKPSVIITSSAEIPASPGSVLQRLTKEISTRGPGAVDQEIAAGYRLLATRHRRLSVEVGRYRQALKKKGLSPSTLEELKLLKGLFPIVGRSAAVIDVRPEHIVRLLESRTINPKTANLYRNDMAAFFHWWSQDQGVRFNPAVQVNLAELKLKVPPPPITPSGRKGTKRLARHLKNSERRLTNQEIRRLLFVTMRYRPDALLILLVSLFLGLRPEAEAIPQWGDIDWDAATWKIQPATVKTREVRTVPIPAFLMAWLNFFRQKKGPIVTFGYEAWKNNIRPNLFARAGVPFHDDCLRVSGISNWVVFHGDLEEVAKWLGNSAYVIKANYLDLPSPSEAAEFMAIFPPEGWIPRHGYRAGRKNWSIVTVDEVMTSAPTLRQWINFLRGKPASAPTVVPEPLRQAA